MQFFNSNHKRPTQPEVSARRRRHLVENVCEAAAAPEVHRVCLCPLIRVGCLNPGQ